MAPKQEVRVAVRPTSARERRLWILGTVVLGAIVAALVFGTWASDLLLRAQTDDAFFWVAMALFALFVAVGLPGRAGEAVLVGLVLAAVALSVLRVLSPAERSHLVEYGALALIGRAILIERAPSGRSVAHPGVVAVLAASVVGVVDELVQWLLPSRVFDPVDLAFNAGAAAGAVAAATVAAWLVGHALARWRRARGEPGSATR